jgi:hypothetical protein
VVEVGVCDEGYAGIVRPEKVFAPAVEQDRLHVDFLFIQQAQGFLVTGLKGSDMLAEQVFHGERNRAPAGLCKKSFEPVSKQPIIWPWVILLFKF